MPEGEMWGSPVKGTLHLGGCEMSFLIALGTRRFLHSIGISCVFYTGPNKRIEKGMWVSNRTFILRMELHTYKPA